MARRKRNETQMEYTGKGGNNNGKAKEATPREAESEVQNLVVNDKTMVVHLCSKDVRGKTACGKTWSQFNGPKCALTGKLLDFPEYVACARCWKREHNGFSLLDWSEKEIGSSSPNVTSPDEQDSSSSSESS